ncbi:MAG: glycosyltransferase family 2 protein [Acidobacteria bacterium]|nr:glycosyltransferase family 2 protein [Acidobacteriota bacterium]
MNLPDFKLLSVIIPVYNEETTISEVIEKVSAVKLPINKEIIVVDDGSTDGTLDYLNNSKDKIARVYLTPVNIGKGAAVRIGLTLARGEIILIQDADLELDPNEYELLLEPILEGRASVVYGSRFLSRNKVSPIRRTANYFLTKTTNILFRTRLTDMETAYKVFTAEVAESLRLRANRFEIEPEITAQIARNGFVITEVPITYRPRTQSEGKKIKWKDGVKALWTLLKYRFLKP